MKITVSSFEIAGTLPAISSKSEAHRLLIAAALSKGETEIACRGTSKDIEATAACLSAMGSRIERTDAGFRVTGIESAPKGEVLLPVGESGSTYRFLAPVAAALGITAVFDLKGRLPERPIDELFTALRAHGCVIDGEGTPRPRISGRIAPGVYAVPGNISSQYISGLLFALPLLPGESRIHLTSAPASTGYIDMTLSALSAFGVDVAREDRDFIVPASRYMAQASLRAGGDWSNAAFFLAAAAAKGSVTLTGIDRDSLQGDREIADILAAFGADVEQTEDSICVSSRPLSGITRNVSDIPDLVPAIAVAAVAAHGMTRLTGAERLALKESDRLRGVTDIINALGGRAECTKDTITIFGGGVRGGTVSSIGDHRMAMMACSMATSASEPVSVTNAGAVEKSYPGFYQDLERLGAHTQSEDEV